MRISLIIWLILIGQVSLSVPAQTANPPPTTRRTTEPLMISQNGILMQSQDNHGRQSATIGFVEFRTRPAVGRKVTVVPLTTNVAPIDLRIIRTTAQPDACDDNQPPHWQVELEPVSDSHYIGAAAPADRSTDPAFGIVVLYPAMPHARLLTGDRLRQSMLPRGVLMKTVTIAMDLNGDGLPDLVMTEF